VAQGFSYYNIKFKKHPIEAGILVMGDIRNESDKNFTTTVFRIKIFIGQEVAGSCILKLPGFRKKTTKAFETLVESVHHAMIPKITKCEIIFDSTF